MTLIEAMPLCAVVQPIAARSPTCAHTAADCWCEKMTRNGFGARAFVCFTDGLGRELAGAVVEGVHRHSL